MAAKKDKEESRLKSYMKVPITILKKASDFYLRGLSECSDQLGHGSVMGFPTGDVFPTYQSCRTSSTGSSYFKDELLRISSSRKGLSGRTELDRIRRRQRDYFTAYNIPRSQTIVTMERIDEEEPCDSADDFSVKNDDVPRRSRSYVVTKITCGIF